MFSNVCNAGALARILAPHSVNTPLLLRFSLLSPGRLPLSSFSKSFRGPPVPSVFRFVFVQVSALSWFLYLLSNAPLVFRFQDLFPAV